MHHHIPNHNATRSLTLPLLLHLILIPPLVTASCFPYGNSTLPGDLSAPATPLQEWWCPQSQNYGFQGFSYPMENYDCNSTLNSFEQMDQDFAAMKRDFGATVVRMYYPTCTKAFIFERAVKAAVKNNMALIFQVWTNFGIGNVWKQSRSAMYSTLNNPKYRDVIPYVVHYADLGSEPIGDGVDGGRQKFVQDIHDFRQHMLQYDIQTGISEDWDRPGIMSTKRLNPSNGLGTGLGPIGKGVAAYSDYAHIHPMPFYHFNNSESEAWPYIQNETLWVKRHTRLPVTITETQWAWGDNYHYPGRNDTGLAQYTSYWKTFDDNCEWFRKENVAWFLHAWRGESTFDIVYPNGSYVIPNWRPRRC